MEIKLNKTLALTCTIIFLIGITVGVPLLHTLYGMFSSESNIGFSTGQTLIMGLTLIVSNFSRLLIGGWLYANSDRFNLDKWTWLAIGLIYGNLALALLVIVLIIEKAELRFDLSKSILPILILSGAALVMKPLTTFFISMSLVKMTLAGPVFFENMDKYNTVLSVVQFGLTLILNICFAISLYKSADDTKKSQRTTWAIATLLLGLLPVILYKGISEIGKRNNAA